MRSMRRVFAFALVTLAGCPSPTETPDAAVAAEDTGPVLDDAPISPDAAAPMDAGPLPEPRADYGTAGAYAVGSVTVTMIDRTGDRTLPVEIWYPADETARAEA
jgi:hypothetical protein